MDRTENGVGILATSTIVGKVGNDISSAAAPVTLEEAKHLGRLRVAVAARFSELSGERAPGNHCTMLDCRCEKRRAVDFLLTLSSKSSS